MNEEEQQLEDKADQYTGFIKAGAFEPKNTKNINCYKNTLAILTNDDYRNFFNYLDITEILRESKGK